MTQRSRNKIRRVVLDHYGSSKCADCGANDDLHLHHVNGDGAAHRRAIGALGAGVAFYGRLVRDGFPDRPPLQVLCGACHAAKHKKK